MSSLRCDCDRSRHTRSSRIARVTGVVLMLTGVRAVVAAPPASLADLQSAFSDLVQRVSPGIVTIEALRRPASAESRRADGMPALRRQSGGGSVLTAEGLILTAEHVIADAEVVHVTLDDGRRVRASVHAADPRSDLAVLRIAAGDLRPIELGDAAAVRRGHLIVVFGNPLGLARDGQAAVSFGMVSAIGRALPESFGRQFDRYYGDLIQTSAPINPGDSGGPLIDVHGRVIGIVTAISSRSGLAEGLGFAVPIDARTRTIIETLKRGEVVEYGYLGIDLDVVTADAALAAGLPAGRGALVQSVSSDGPAGAAGLRRGDIITRFDGMVIESHEQLIRLIGAATPGATVHIEYRRGTEWRTAQATLARRAAPSVASRQPPTDAREWRGALLAPASDAMRRAANAPAGTLLVLGVNTDSPAERAGLEPGDLIVRIAGRDLATPDEASAALQRAAGDTPVGLAGGGSRLVRPR